MLTSKIRRIIVAIEILAQRENTCPTNALLTKRENFLLAVLCMGSNEKQKFHPHCIWFIIEYFITNNLGTALRAVTVLSYLSVITT